MRPPKLVIRHSLQLCVFCLGLLEDRDVGVGVFPEREEILVGSAGFGRVALQGVGTRQPGQQHWFIAYLTACAAFRRRVAGSEPASATLTGRGEFL